jgi:hypothetical protein
MAAAAAAPSSNKRRASGGGKQCEYQAQARAFVQTLDISTAYFEGNTLEATQHDRCYCLECYPAAWPDKITNQGPTPYVIPRGWVRIGLADNRLLDRTLKVFAEWSVSFHGVKSVAALRSILQERRLMTPGETLMDGIFSDNPSISPFPRSGYHA